ncbi:hypothetical protein SAMN05421805_102257 [Saccharopolyspora antimicrobica]|uniref:Uncharacterized protein n=1 Tax=Saccharopolyspora antimicrobica TaxID=455193 RepID=A0A1I4VKS3_9PSEU|nr:hypothetical protein ATL45_5730 [Saccharopolyspora antimicrobica]SFN01852.1 hypothetical protein SAMN05421805_102257 [Saccharopolyspora antimicrobica]
MAKIGRMSGDEKPVRRVKVTAEVIFEVTDVAAVERAALEDIAQTSFAGDEAAVAEIVAEEQEAVRGDLIEAVSWLADPERMISFEVPGIQCGLTTYGVDDLDNPESAWYPDFGSLFQVCGCRLDSCDRCAGYELTPRMAAVLSSMSQMLADQAYDDVIEHGDEPVENESAWSLFAEYPRVTWRQDAVWRRQAARAFDDLAADLEAGDWPLPRCPAEEMALHLTLRYAQAAVDDGWAGFDGPLKDVPEYPDDFEWDALYEMFFQDLDILSLFDVELDGIEDPETETNRHFGIGDYRPQAWFRSFNNMEPRDGRRPFRR